MFKNKIIILFSFFVLTVFATGTVFAGPFFNSNLAQTNQVEHKDDWHLEDWDMDDRHEEDKGDHDMIKDDDKDVKTGTVMAVGEESESFPVRVDVKPGDEFNEINLAHDKTIQVIVFGSSDLDASNVDHDSITLNGVKHDGDVEVADHNNDGIADLVLTFSTEGLDLNEGINGMTVTGETKDGKTFEGSDRVMVGTDNEMLFG